MPLYSWPSQYLKAYSTGLLIAVADTPDAARAHLRQAFEARDRERYDWNYWTYGPSQEPDEEDVASIAERRALFEADLLAEPTVHPSHTLFVPGSD